MISKSVSVLENLHHCLSSLHGLVETVLKEIKIRIDKGPNSNNSVGISVLKHANLVRDKQSKIELIKGNGNVQESKLSKLGFFGSAGEKAEVYRLAKLIIEGPEVTYLQSLLQDFVSTCKNSLNLDQKSGGSFQFAQKPTLASNEYLNLIGEEEDDEVFIKSEEMLEPNLSSEHSSTRMCSGALNDFSISPNQKQLKKQFSIIREETEESICEGSVLEVKAPKQDIAAVFKKNLKPGYLPKKTPLEVSAQLKDGKLETDSSENESELDESKTLRKPLIKHHIQQNPERPYSTKTIPSGSNISPIDTSSRYLPDSIFGSHHGRLASVSEEPTLLHAASIAHPKHEELPSKPNYIISSGKRDTPSRTKTDIMLQDSADSQSDKKMNAKLPEYFDTSHSGSDQPSKIRIGRARGKSNNLIRVPAEREHHYSSTRFASDGQQFEEERSTKQPPRRAGSSEDQSSGLHGYRPQSSPRRTLSHGISRQSRLIASSTNTKLPYNNFGDHELDRPTFDSSESSKFSRIIPKKKGSPRLNRSLGSSFSRGQSPSMIIKRRTHDSEETGIYYQTKDSQKDPPNSAFFKPRDSTDQLRSNAPKFTEKKSRQSIRKPNPRGSLSEQDESRSEMQTYHHPRSLPTVTPDDIGYKSGPEFWTGGNPLHREPGLFSQQTRHQPEPLISAKVIYENLVNFKKQSDMGQPQEGGPNTTRGLFQKTKRSSRHPQGDRASK